MSNVAWARVEFVAALAVLLRIALILYGAYQDAHSVLKYTDVDYRVFSDATKAILHPTPHVRAQGWLVQRLGWNVGDPYARETYRYTPLLALALIPNEIIHPAFGKVLFAACDILIGILLHALSRGSRADAPSVFWVAALWLLSPMPANISTRGSAESVLGLIVIATLGLAMRRKYDGAAIMLGFAVHFKIYPFIYGASILASMSPSPAGGSSSKKPLGFIARQLTAERVRFGAVSFATFVLLNTIMYSIWGFPFLEHSYIYHLTRKDHRHNFSPYFYATYLAYARNATSSGGAQFSALAALVFRITRSPLVSFVPQMTLAVGSGFVFGRRREDLPFAWFVQTAAFVTFNKVCTSQYFMWYMWFLPLVLPRLAISLKKALLLLGLWVGAQALWLSIAYRLEFLGEDVFVPLWAASIIFFGVNSYVLGQLVLAYN